MFFEGLKIANAAKEGHGGLISSSVYQGPLLH
jgi:hypothetical protein